MESFDVIILGGGPAGLSAAIYSARGNNNTAVIDINMFGGQPSNYLELENYPGFDLIGGYDLMEKFENHADKFGVKKFPMQEIVSVDLKNKKIITKENEFTSKTIILAMGAGPQKLGIKGEKEFLGRGVSYCAVCDGAFYKDKITAVNGGGDVAVEDAIFLARGCEKVYLVHRRDELRAAKILQKALLELPNVEVKWSNVPVEIKGADEGMVKGLVIKDVKTDTQEVLDVSGVFIATGNNNPNSSYTDTVAKDEKGYIIADESCATNIPGVFAAGDIRAKRLRQVSTAVADGANAVYSVQEYLI